MMSEMQNGKSQGWGLALLRIVVGFVFVMHGGQKLFVYGIDGVAGAFLKYGLPLPMVSAVLATAAEFLGGLALLAGFRTRLAAVPVAATMVVAILSVHLGAGFFLPGFEYPLTLLAALLTLILAGPGTASVDALLAGRKS